VSRRPTLGDLRRGVLDVLGDEWMATTRVADELQVGHGLNWYRIALVLERLAADGEIELKRPARKVRRFRKRRPSA
jgi:hypothetical protein